MCVKMFVWDKKSFVCSGKSRQVQRILYICNAMADNSDNNDDDYDDIF